MSVIKQVVDERNGWKATIRREGHSATLSAPALRALRSLYGLLPARGCLATPAERRLTRDQALAFFDLRPGQFQALQSICDRLGAAPMATLKLIATMDAQRADEFILEHQALLEAPARRPASTLRVAG